MIIDGASITAFSSAIFLPWMMGIAVVVFLLGHRAATNLFIVTGQGYLVGVFLTTLIIQLWHMCGLPFNFWIIALAMFIVVVTVGVLALFTGRFHYAELPSMRSTAVWQMLAVVFFLCLIGFRYSTLTQELLLRPLYAWDAWMNWAPKASVWFFHGELIPFVSKETWLAASSDEIIYTAGASQAFRYPDTVPILQLWMMMALNTDDSTLIYLPWLCVAVAMGLAMYGHVRLAGGSVLASTVASYVLMSLPLFGVHVGLPGYADLWLTAAFGCSVLALHEWYQTRQWPYAVLSLALALMCTQLKIPGLIMGGIVLLVFLVAASGIKQVVGFLLVALVAVAVAITVLAGVDVVVPGLGRVVIARDFIQLPYIGRYDLMFHPVQSSIIETLFIMINWNLLWYVFLLFAFLGIVQGAMKSPPSIVLAALLLGILFIFFVYFFTNRYEFALDFTQVNRALIYLTPLMVFYVFSIGRQRLELLART